MAKKKAKKAKEESCMESCCSTKKPKCSCMGSSSCVYFLGFIGAAIFYISNATGFWNGVLGVLKALVWPAILVLDILQFLHP